ARGRARPRLYALRTRTRTARDELASGQSALRALRDKLAGLTGAQQGAADLTIPMPSLGQDRDGLTAYGGLLAFAWTGDAPFVLDSASGDVVLYFRGGDGQFFSAYYDTRVFRGAQKLDAGGSPIRLMA